MIRKFLPLLLLAACYDVTVYTLPEPEPPPDEPELVCACEAEKARAVYACFKWRETCVNEPGHHAFTATCFETACRFSAFTRAVECAEACGLPTAEWKCRAHCGWIMDTCLRGQAETGGPPADEPNRCARIEWECYATTCPTEVDL